jgi:TonB family protein
MRNGANRTLAGPWTAIVVTVLFLDAPVAAGPAGASNPAVAPPADGLTEQITKDLVASRRDQVNDCCARALEADPRLSGRVRLAIRVRDDGTVASARASAGTPRNPELEQCLRSVYEDMTFPPRPGGVTLRQDIVLHPDRVALASRKGAKDRERIERVIRAKSGGVEACAVRALKRRDTLDGTVTVRFTLDPAGRVADAAAHDDSTGDTEVASCLVDLVRGIRFPAPRGHEATFTRTFELHASR